MPFVLRMFGQPADGPRRAALLRRALAFFGLALIVATWRLWTPQQVFPQVPLFGFARLLPPWCDWLGAGGMIAGLTVALVSTPGRRLSDAGLLLFVASTALMAVLDQGRLQPWAYQFLLMALVLALADARFALALLRLFVVSFYFHSAISKFDHSFLHTLGQQFLAALVGAFGGTLDAWSDESRLAAAMTFPAAELAVALGLCFARTRTVALAGAITLHLLLLVILGPVGLGHKPGVLVWNVYFIVQDVLLFGGLRSLPATASLPEPPPHFAPRFSWVVQTMMWAAVLLPFLAPTTWFDTWPAWGLYAPSAERVALYVHRRAVGSLPDDLLRFLDEPDDPQDPWHRLRLDRWALETLDAPIYPQSRYQLGVAREVVARYAPVQRARVVRFDLADRFTGRRTHDVFVSLPQLVNAGSEYYFNTGPRQAMFQPSPQDPQRPPRAKNQ